MTQTVLLGDLMAEKGYIRGPFGSALRRPEMKAEGIPVYEQQNAIYNHRDFRFFIDDQKYIELKRFTVKPGDLLISCSGTLGKITIIRPEDKIGIISQALLILRVDQEKVLPEYLYYFLTSAQGQYLLLGASHGSVQTNIAKRAVVEAIKISLPSLPEQHEIVSILGTIDEKIELNRRMNETLEQMGQALFRHYFIDNPEAETWEMSLLGDFVELVNGASYKSTELQPSSNALVTLKSIGRGGGFSRRGYKEFTGKMKDTQIVRDGDLVVAHTDLTQRAEVAGYPAIVDGADQYDQVAISMDLVKVVPRSKELSSSVVYFLLKTHEFQNHKMGYISGSTVLHLNKKCIPTYEMALPPDAAALQVISSEFDDVMEKIKNSNQQIQTLTTLRDTLLPRLISRKVAV